MNHVIRHIEYLVHRHDCVVLPKWGAFIAHYQPACYDGTLGVMYPPLRELSFSASVDYDDGLLASSIARKEGISFNQASRMMEEELSSMKHQLDLDGEISLGNVGRFIRQDGVSAVFEPSALQSHIVGAGFDAFAIKPLLSKVREEALSAGRIEAPRRGRLSRIGLVAIKAAAVIAVLIGVSVVLLRPTFHRSDDMASIAPVMSHKSSQMSAVPALSETRTLNISVPKDCDATAAEAQVSDCDNQPVVADSQDNMVTIRLNPSDRYCLVVASLPSMSLAEKFVEEHKSHNLGILGKDSRYRVYAATGNTTNETLKAKENALIGAEFADAWVCSMR